MAAKIEQDQGPPGLEDKQVVALIAYLDRLGVDLFAILRPARLANALQQTAQSSRPGRASSIGDAT